MSCDWIDHSRETAVWAVRTHRLTPATRVALRQLLDDLLEGLISRCEFQRRWEPLALGAADGLKHLLMLVEIYLDHVPDLDGPQAFTTVERIHKLSGPRHALELIVIYRGELEGDWADRRDTSPIPAARPSPGADALPVPALPSAQDVGNLPIPRNQP